MGKIICDVCGTSFPESAAQCPICGCVRSLDAKTVHDNRTAQREVSNGGYTYVKGGRFSKSNVKKRNRAAQNPQVEHNSQEEKKNTDKGIIIAICILALAIVAVIAYILVRFFLPSAESAGMNVTGASAMTQQTTESTAAPTELLIPCESVEVSAKNVEFKKPGGVRLLNVKVLPADTTDELLFSSSDENVATVNEDGKIQAVGPGEAVITVSCGSVSKECTVICNFESETTGPENEPTTEPTTLPAEDFKLLKDDVTLSYKGEVWLCYSGEINVKDIEWSSDDVKVATVTDGKVVAVATGTTVIRGKYNGVEAKCTVRCSAAVGAYEEPTTGDGDAEETPDKNYSISSTDVTIKVGESFDLVLKDADGYPLDATWQVSGDFCTVEGNIVTGTAVGTAKVFTVYEGKEYACTVRVTG